MKKLLGLVMLMALFVPAAQADILKDVSTYGEIQVLGNMDRHIGDDKDDYSNTSVRVLYGIHGDLTEDVAANLTLLYRNTWGNPNGPTEGKDVDNYLSEIFVTEANVVISNLFDRLEAKIGRQFYGDENSAVIYFGPKHYITERPVLGQDGNTALALDALKVSYLGEMFAADFIYAKFTDVIDQISNDDTTMWGLDTKFMPMDGLTVQAYIYDIENIPGGINLGKSPGTMMDTHVGIYGVKPTLEMDNILISAEYARNYQSQGVLVGGDVDRYMAKIDAAIALDNFTPRATYYRNKGFYSYGNYVPGLLVGQDMMFDTNTDLAVVNVGVDFALPFEILEKVAFSADAFGFYNRNMSKEHAYEGDLWIKYNHNENVELHLAGALVKTPGFDSIERKLQSGVIVKF